MPGIERSQGRRAFGGDPAGYDRARPGYPDRVYEVLVSRCGLRTGSRTFEIGPGTGQATRQLLRLGAAPLVLVEPDERLGQYLASNLASPIAAGSVVIRHETFEDVELPAASFDLGVAATSFHWIDPEVKLRKVARLLRPGGWWAMWWNSFGDPARVDAFHEATQDILKPLARSPFSPYADRPSHALDVDARLAEFNATGDFEEIAYEMIPWTLTRDPAGVRALFATFSEITCLRPDERDPLLDRLQRVAAEQFGGKVEKPMVTAIYSARRR
jgi:SAM-dependent methyltransferase